MTGRAPLDDDITALLEGWSRNDDEATQRLFELTYRELHRLAKIHTRREGHRRPLQTTALLHEAYLRMGGRDRIGFRSRRQFFAFASESMRRVLVDRARERLAAKRGGGLLPVPFLPGADFAVEGERSPEELLALNHALVELGTFDPELRAIVDMKCFAGLGNAEIAEVRGKSLSDVKRKWRLGRKWLAQRLNQGPQELARPRRMHK